MSAGLRVALRSISILACSAALSVACGDDGAAEEHGAEEHGAEEHGHEAPLVCSEITDVCHDADMGSGMAHDCHETAHEGDAAACETIHDACIAFCAGGSGSTTSPMDSSSSESGGSSSESGSSSSESGGSSSESGSSSSSG